ncbi:bifunctional DNA-binding transcriptional regulator/O6-methylguanine-DNA methyltransferase Ada [Alcaligenaceae bacterium]|nr:bifunctional DNA-binding transcriptional regulator/O6-methylguanine-DNA methyltransferase Ada [Alcaligenaceae bacterium]
MTKTDIAMKRSSTTQTRVLAIHTAMVSTACRYIESAKHTPTLAELAQQANISSYHFHRLFKAITGLTPRAYATAHRAQKMRGSLANQQASITDAIYDAGFESNSSFYAEVTHRLGMRPKDYRSGGKNTDIYFAIGQCSLGAILVAQSPRGVCAILMDDDPEQLVHNLQDLFPKANLLGADPDFEDTIANVIGLVEAPGLGLNLPLDVQGTVFQERVWQALRDIPVGTTATYTEIAQRIGLPKAIRAVASACGANRLAVAIPCHRVVRSDGNLTGYRWGIERKQALLEREALHIKTAMP